jgi:hypothetical protein
MHRATTAQLDHNEDQDSVKEKVMRRQEAKQQQPGVVRRRYAWSPDTWLTTTRTS